MQNYLPTVAADVHKNQKAFIIYQPTLSYSWLSDRYKPN